MPAIRGICNVAVILALLFMACKSQSGRSFVPAIAGYHDKQHEVFVLKDDLLEVSGIYHMGDLRFAAA